MSFNYIHKYDSIHLRGVDQSKRPWNLFDEIIKYANPCSNLLDIGCGTSFKLLSLSPYFNNIIGVDISEDMINYSNKIIKVNDIRNIKLILCDSKNLPFLDKSYDVITCMLSRWEVSEIYRLLKPTGTVIVEHIGCEDKKDLKILFGKDEFGWRGQLIDYAREEYLEKYNKIFGEFFNNVIIKNGFWETYYTKKGLLELLNYTPSIRNFNVKQDNNILKKIHKIFKYQSGVKLKQNRILIHASNYNIF